MDFSELDDSMGAFESAVQCKPTALHDIAVTTILLAIEGSSRDDTARTLAARLAAQLGAKVVVTMSAREGQVGDGQRALVDAAVSSLRAEGRTAEPQFSTEVGAAKQILALQREVGAGLIVVPTPYLDDYSVLTDESLGVAVDMLAIESPVSLLLVRAPLPELGAEIDRVFLPMTLASPGVTEAVSWALALSPSGSEIDLLAVAERRTAPATESVEMTLRASQAEAGGVIAALQKKGAERDVVVHVDHQAGKPLALMLQSIHARPCLVVVGSPRDKYDDDFHRAHDITLGAKMPVLVARVP